MNATEYFMDDSSVKFRVGIVGVGMTSNKQINYLEYYVSCFSHANEILSMI